MTPTAPRGRRKGSNGGRSAAGWTCITGLVAALLSGCTSAPDRSTDADAVTAALRLLPGVTTVDAKYTNAPMKGESYNVAIMLSPDSDRAQVVAVAQSYDEQIAAVGFEGHTLSFSLSRGADRMTSGRDRPTRAAVSPAVGRWFDLTEQLTEPVDRYTSEDLDLITITTADVADLVERIRADATDLGSAHWLIHSGRSRIDLKGGYPYPATGALISRLVADRADWTIAHDPQVSPSLTFSVWLEPGADPKSTARGHLRQIAALDAATTYTLKVSGGPFLTVAVHGCLAGGPPVQQELNAEFGTC